MSPAPKARASRLCRSVAPPLAGMVALAGCVTEAGGPVVSLSMDRAVALFDGVCGASLPGFATAPDLAQANGFRPAGEGTFDLPDGGATLRLGRAADGEPICALDVVTRDDGATVDAALAQIATYRSVAPGERVGRARGSVTRVVGPEPVGGDAQRYSLEFRPEG